MYVSLLPSMAFKTKISSPVNTARPAKNCLLRQAGGAGDAGDAGGAGGAGGENGTSSSASGW